ncbi:MAG: trehalose-phosphatase [Actinomycetota bacterium]
MTSPPFDAFVRDPARAGLFLDFDGVLSDIAPTPDGAVPRPGVPELLLDLQQRLGRVAIVSGRPVDYLAPFVPSAVDIVGLYGLESRVGGANETLPEAEGWRPVILGLIEEATAAFGPEVVEPKGLSLTIHYRSDDALAAPVRAWVEDAAARTGAEARPAKRSFEVHPPIARDKGTAVVELAGSLDPVAYVGDDLGDLPAFDGLDRLARRGVTTVRVAVASHEAPTDLIDRADHIVDGPAGAQALLTDLARSLGSARR